MCVFCSIVNNDIPSYKLYEDNDFLVFLDISQATRGHTLVISKKHFPDIYSLDEEIASKIFILVQKMCKAVKKATGCCAINIINNNGEKAGQTVNHYHIHIIPRYNNDSFAITFNHTHLNEVDFVNLKEEIKNAIE